MELKVYISGTQYRVTDKYQIVEQSGAISTSTLDVRLDDHDPPKSLSLVQVYDPDDVLFFSGIIQSVDFPVYSKRYETHIYSIQVASLSCIFNNRLVSEAYNDMYTHEIVADIFTNYLVEEGLTLGTIDTFTRLYETYTSNRLKLYDVLTELGDAVGAIPLVTADKVFYFISKQSFNAITPPTHITGLAKAENGANLQTVQYISGASESTSTQTKSFTWVSGQTEIPLAYQVASVIGISINGTPCGVGIQGIDSDDASKTFLWKYSLQTIALNASATVKPVAGDTVVCAYKGYYSIEVQSTNEALQQEIKVLNGTSGKIEVVTVDATITSLADGESAAADALTVYGSREEEINLICHDITASTLLSIWPMAYSDLYITGDYVVVERTITDFYDRYKIQVKLKNRGFYSRYGTIYNKNNKTINDLTVRVDDLVSKTSNISESFMFSEELDIIDGGMIYYATDGTMITAPELGGFYPS